MLAFDATACDCGDAKILIVGAAFLTFDNVIVSNKVLVWFSLSVTLALTNTLVALVEFPNVFPFNVTNPVAAVVEIEAISDEFATNVVIVLLVVALSYVSEITTVELEKPSTCAPVDFADTDWAFGLIDMFNNGAAFLAFEYVTSFVKIVWVPLPSW